MFFAQAAPPPASYSHQVAPTLALHCNGCHGGASRGGASRGGASGAGGLSTRSYDDLMRGGNLGKVVIPGDPERSLLLDFVEGRRGEEHRMPLGGRPLSPQQVAAIRRWIGEGAKPDADTTTKYKFTLPNVRASRKKLLQVSCQVNTQSYLILTLWDRRKKRALLTEVASIKWPQDRGDTGRPGELISWYVRPAKDWPRWFTAELTVAYAEQEPRETVFSVKLLDRQR